MKKLLIENYKGHKIYFYNEFFRELGENIINKNIEVIKEIKATERSYVVKIKYNEEYYVLKSPKSEYKKFQKKIMTLFKKGEALSTLININKTMDRGLDFFARPYLAIVKRKKGVIVSSYFVIEYFLEEKRKEYKKDEIEEWLKLGEKLHNEKIYHGDLNPANIIKTNRGFKFIDTKCKHYYLGQYRSNYDKLTLEYSTYGTLGRQNWYKKDIWFKIALKIKTIRNGEEKDDQGIK